LRQKIIGEIEKQKRQHPWNLGEQDSNMVCTLSQLVISKWQVAVAKQL